MNTEQPASFKCPRCKRVSHHPDDVSQGWCAACNDFTADPRSLAGRDVALLQELADIAYWGPRGPEGGNRVDAPSFEHPNATLRIGMIVAALLERGVRPAPAIVERDGRKDPEEEIAALALSFPSLREPLRPGLKPWNPGAFESWLVGPAPSSGAFHAGAFVLGVWNPRATWRCGRFDLVKAMGLWDAHHVGAFATWAAKPWFV